MSVNPLAIGAGSAVATGLVVGFGTNAITDSIAERHPTGSDVDAPAGRVQAAGALLGVAMAAGGMFSMWRGNLPVGAALFGGGAGAMIGSFGAGLAFGARHGIGVDTSVRNVLGSYDDDRNGQIEMLDRGWLRPAETTRSETTTHEDSVGDTHTHTTYYSIERLAARADVDGDLIATREELSDAIAPYDADGNGRLQGDELKRFDHELGERVVG